jgi:hypothetical protein
MDDEALYFVDTEEAPGSILTEEPPPAPEPPDEPDAGFIKQGRRDRYAVQYEKKVKTLLNTGMRITIQNPNTVADAAALIMYGPDVARTVGDLAAKDPWVRKAVDFVAGGADNPYMAVLAAVTPLVLQVLRNHEPVVETPKQFRIPFTKRVITIRFKLKLGKLRNLSNDPAEFATHVLSNEDIQTELAKQGIMFAKPQNNGRAN